MPKTFFFPRRQNKSRTTRSTAILAGFGVAVLLVLTACGGSSGSASTTKTQSATTQGSSSGHLTKWTMAVFPGEDYLLDFVAQDKGIFKQHGLDVKFVFPQSGAAAAQLLLGGAIQGWSTGLTVATPIAAKGQDIRLAGMVLKTSEAIIDVADKDQWPSDSASLKEKMAALQGKVVGVSGINAGVDRQLQAILKLNGLDVSKVHRVGIGTQTAAISQFNAGRLDAYISFTKAGSLFIEQAAKTHAYADLGQSTEVPASIRDVSGLVMATTGSFADAHPDLIKAWRASELDALNWVMRSANADEAGQIMSKYSFGGKSVDISTAVVRDFQKNTYPQTPKDLSVSREGVDATVKLLADQGAISPGSVSYDSLVLPVARAS